MTASLVRTAFLPSNKTLTIALLVSVLVHASLLVVRFVAPETFRLKPADPQLEIILVNAKSDTRNHTADALAQVALAGGGDQAEGRAKSPLPPTAQIEDGDALQQSQRRVAELEEQQRQLMAQARAAKHAVQEVLDKKGDRRTEAALSGDDLLANAKLMARQFAQIDKQVEDYNKRPRRHNYAPSTSEYKYAQYVEGWRQKIERIGSLNYPEAARGKFYGQLILTVSIKADGTVERIDIDRSSGVEILDQAALRIVRMGEPYGQFPPSMRKDTDILAITRTWTFSNDTLETRGK